MTQNTLKFSKLPDNFYKNFKKIFINETNDFNMNNFETIGLTDPFPMEERNI